MSDLAFGTSAYSRTRGSLPELPLINLFVEASPVSEKGVVLQGRPGLVAHGDPIGEGPIRALYHADGVVGGQTVTISGDEVYIGETLLDTIEGSGPVSFAASEDELLINAGGPIYRTDGLALTTVTFPDDADVSRLVDLAGYFIAIRKDTQQLYFSAVLDGTSWDALDYTSAENEPDPLRDALVANDTLILFGSQTVEFHTKTGNPDAPFAPIEGRVFPKGVVGTGCAVKFDNGAAWIGSVGPVIPGIPPSLRVYTIGNIAEGISEPGIEERLTASSTWALWAFTFEGHEFLCVRLDSGTWLYDAQTKQWCEFASYGRGNWRVRCAVGGLFGDDETGQLWTLGPGYVDDGGPLEARFRAGVPMTGGAVIADNIRVSANVGETPDLTGYTAEPTVEMRTSRDAGRTWAGWRSVGLGAQGKYRTRVEWRRCGMFDDPGLLAEFRITDPVPRRFSAVSVNEKSGGRPR
jgi:hypothetical protein